MVITESLSSYPSNTDKQDKTPRSSETHKIKIINRQNNIINGTLLIATEQGTNPIRLHGENIIRDLCFSNNDAFIRDLERSVYNWTVRKITGTKCTTPIPPIPPPPSKTPQLSVDGGGERTGSPGFCADYRHFKWIYKHKIISVAFNIRRYIHLWMMLTMQTIKPSQIAFLRPETIDKDLWSPFIEKSLTRGFIEDEATAIAKSEEGLYTCPKCRSKFTKLLYQMQTRSADEPMTCYHLCGKCGKRWKS